MTCGFLGSRLPVAATDGNDVANIDFRDRGIVIADAIGFTLDKIRLGPR